MTFNGEPRKILVVEDDPLLAATLSRQIARLQPNATITSAAACHEAQEMWQAQAPDLVLLDYRLPDGFGTDLLREMRRLKKDTPVIFMSGESEQISAEQRKDLNIEEVMTKPVPAEQLQNFFAQRKAQPVSTHQRNQKLGRFRVIRIQTALTTERCMQLMRRMQALRTNWIVLQMHDTNLDSSTCKTLASWAAWLSANGGRLCLLAENAKTADVLQKSLGMVIDIFTSPESVKADQLRLTGFAERQRLLHAIRQEPPLSPAGGTAPAQTTKKSGFTATAIMITMLLLSLSISIVGAFLFATRTAIVNTPDLTPYELAARWAQEALDEGDALMAFHYLSEAIERAETESQRLQSVHEMVLLLMEDRLIDTGISRPHRSRMVAEYIRAIFETIALPDHILSQFCRFTFQISQRLNDAEILRMAENMMDNKAPSVETLFHAFDAYAFFDQPRKALLTLTEINNRDNLTPNQSLALRYRRMRVLERAMEDNAWMLAGGKRYANVPHENMMAYLRNLLKQEATALSSIRVPPFNFHGHMALARLAEKEERYADAILHAKALIATPGNMDAGYAATMLLRNLRRTNAHSEANTLRDEFMTAPQTAEAAFLDLIAQFQTATTQEQKTALLNTVDLALANLPAVRTDAGNLLIEAAQAAKYIGDTARMTRYLEADETFDHQRRRVAQRYLKFAQLAGLEGNQQKKIENLQNLIQVSPDRDIERKARFLLFDTLLADHSATADLMQTIVGISVRFPNDPELVPRLRITAERLEQKSLYTAAELYFSQAALLGTLHVHNKVVEPTEAAKAMLGQSRVLLATGRVMDADNILRTVNSQERWSDVWPDAGPLWATIAMQNRQPQEAIRRWRQTSGPPQGPLLPMLFDILVPNLQNITPPQGRMARKPPATIPVALVQASADQAMSKLLAQNAYDRISLLLEAIENDPIWRATLPVHAYRLQTFEHIIAREPIPAARQWLATQSLTPHDVTDAQLAALEQLAQRAQSMVF